MADRLQGQRSGRQPRYASTLTDLKRKTGPRVWFVLAGGAKKVRCPAGKLKKARPYRAGARTCGGEDLEPPVSPPRRRGRHARQVDDGVGHTLTGGTKGSAGPPKLPRKKKEKLWIGKRKHVFLGVRMGVTTNCDSLCPETFPEARGRGGSSLWQVSKKTVKPTPRSKEFRDGLPQGPQN